MRDRKDEHGAAQGGKIPRDPAVKDPGTLRLRGVRIRPIPIRSLFPNVLTLIALCAGLTAIRLALQGHWESAVIAITVAGIFDALDGRMARLLKGTSKFGAELDSLSDVIAFGVAPALVMYLWALRDLKGAGWVLALAYCVCCALRLARFNTAEDDPAAPIWTKHYFVGLPAPGAAGLVILPLMASLYLENDLFRSPALCGFVFAIVAFLMVSQVPTLSAKRIAIKREYALHILVTVGLLTALVATFPWLVLTIVGLLYAGSVPYTAWRYRRQARREAALATEAAAASTEDETGVEVRHRDASTEEIDPDEPPKRSVLH
jgi:CDP-diacylglycerol---serine O-phosphatidyltransferase